MALDIPAKLSWDFPDPFIQEITVSEADIDELSHTNNTTYIRWCDRIAWAHTESLGLGVETYKRLDRAMAMRQAKYEYLAATFCGEELILGTWIYSCDGKLQTDRCFQLLRKSDGKSVFKGKVDFVCIELSSGKPRRMPAEFIEGYTRAART